MPKRAETFEIKIRDLSESGEGIGRAMDFALFVKDALPGDEVRVKIMKCKKTYGFAKLEKILTPSPDRCDPRCPEHMRCGGCQIQALKYEKQLEIKNRKIRDALERIGGIPGKLLDEITEPILGMEDPWRYRNKAQYPVGTDREGNPITGFYAGHTHSIIQSEDCLLEPEGNSQILDAVLSYMREEKVPAYDEETGKGVIRHVLIRRGMQTGEILVCLVINADRLPKEEKLVEKLARIDGMTSVSVSVNKARNNVIMGESARTIYGQDYITDRIRMRDMTAEGYPFTGKELTFRISALSFYQVNPVQMEKLYSTALSYAGLTGKETVWDLYCGIGTISLFLAAGAEAGSVYGVEIIPDAIRDAKENAKINGIENAEFFVGAAEEVLPAYYEKLQEGGGEEKALHPEVIVVDPPRKGCDEACLQTILKMQPDRLVYVSCNPASLARDLKILLGGGYHLKKVRGVDMFPHTMHVETVVLLSRVTGKEDR